MYGLINNALQNMIREKFGDEQWQKVLDASGVSEDSFLSMRSYDDAITYDLAAAASEVLGAPVADCLEMFGEYWVLEIATKAYGPLMDASGENIVEFLGNLNALHDRITSTFINYVPPEFQVEKLNEKRYKIHYISQRRGLEGFVVGLLKGLSVYFSSGLEILGQEELVVDSGSHHLFKVNLG